MSEDLRIDTERVVPGVAMEWKAARASGPGGQHVNRTESKIQLTFNPRLVPWMDEGTRLRIIALSGRNVDSEGCVQVTSQENREQPRNLENAREKLKELITRALVRPKKRIATKPTKASKRRRLADKKHEAGKKQQRSRVRAED